MAAESRRGARLVNVALSLAVSAGVLLLAEPVLRMRYVEPEPETPAAVLEVQPWLRLHPDVGYTWLPNVGAQQGVIFHNADIEYEPLSTDEFGVVNAPEAIARRRVPVDILGLGDSFMEMAAHDFYRTFAATGTSYYSLAIHRHAPPHYARMFALHGSAMRARVVIIGLFENDFAETQDFDAWRQSGLDWFAYHSGTWCGRTVPMTAGGRFVNTYFKGYAGLARVLRMRLRGERMSLSGPTEYQVRRVIEELNAAADSAHANGSDVWLMLIPSKPTARGEVTAESRAYDRVTEAMTGRVAGIVDLRPTFQGYPDPLSLYYREDGHWNRAGVALAAQELSQRLAHSARADESRSD